LSIAGAFLSPTAMRLMSPAALRYASSSVGESFCSSAMLSKLALIVSCGSQSAALTSTSSRSFTARAYSGRFRPLERAAARIRIGLGVRVDRRLERL
jgi:hypothetical protein